MNNLRIMSIFGLATGVGMAIVGFRLSNHLSQTLYGRVPPPNAACSSTMPSSVVTGWFLATLGAIVAFVSFAVLAHSFVRICRS